jgi:RHS repeat-associated protein
MRTTFVTGLLALATTLAACGEPKHADSSSGSPADAESSDASSPPTGNADADDTGDVSLTDASTPQPEASADSDTSDVLDTDAGNDSSVADAATDATADDASDAVVDSGSNDNDSDGLTNDQEIALGTNPNVADSDGDGIADGAEVGNVQTPTDTDGDGKIDALESATADVDGDGKPDSNDSDPLDGPLADRDGDGLTNGQEASLGTNPDSADSDSDGVTDSIEVGNAQTPTDTDGDGKIDALESATADVDGDGKPDSNDADALDGPLADRDGDGLTNAQEALLGTNPDSADSDGDGTSDGAEVGSGASPIDTDGDGIIDALESSTADEDGDGVPDSADARTRSTVFAYDLDGRLQGEYDENGNPLEELVYLEGRVIASIRSNGIRAVQTDQVGAPRAVVENGKKVWSWDPDAYGSTAPNEDPDSDGVTFTFDERFPGQRYEAATGLNRNFHRNYAAWLGRYVEADPIGLAGGSNIYAYASWNPMQLIDPPGLSPNDIAAIQAVIDRRAAEFPNRIDNGLVNNVVGYFQGPFMDGLVNITRDMENDHIDAYNRNVRARDPKAKLKPNLPKRENFWTLNELLPGCGEQAQAALSALLKDPRFRGWEVREVTRGTNTWIPGYHHKVYARNPATGEAYSVDMHNAREVRPWTDADNDFK